MPTVARRSTSAPRRCIARSSASYERGVDRALGGTASRWKTETGGHRRSPPDRDGVGAATRRASALDAGVARRAVVRLTAHTAFLARRSAAGWRRTTSNRGRKRCGACRKSMPRTSRAWRTSSVSTRRCRALGRPSSASTNRRTNLLAKSAPRGRWSLDIPRATTTNTGGGHGECLRRGGCAPTAAPDESHGPPHAVDFAEWLRDLVDLHYSSTERILVVLDNLSTHTPAALYEAFPPAEARRLLRRLEFHYVPKHASWLNMVEIEIGVLASSASIGGSQTSTLAAEVEAWTPLANDQRGGEVDVWHRTGAREA